MRRMTPVAATLVGVALTIGSMVAAAGTDTLVLVMRAHAAFGSVSAEEMDEAERPDHAGAPAVPAAAGARQSAARKEAA